jgi:hypothetical protein
MEPRDAGPLDLAEAEPGFFEDLEGFPYDPSMECFSTCNSGLTLRCDGQTIPSGCKSTCITGMTIRCDGHTLK